MASACYSGTDESIETLREWWALIDPPEPQVWLDGARVPSSEARVSVFDRGFLYGDSIFETVRTYDRQPFALAEHLQRLAQSARRVWIELPVGPDVLAREVDRALAQSPFNESYLRLMVTRGVGSLGLNPESAVCPLRVMIVAQLSPPPAQDYERGISVISFVTTRVADATEAAGAKIGNYLTAVLANREAAKRGAKEALICDARGHVVEGATSNVFWVQGGVLHTPPLEAGILAGITRAHLLEVARGLSLQMVFDIPHIDQLMRAEEVFISSSIREVLPVCRIDDHPIAQGTPGPVTLDLLSSFRRHCQIEVGRRSPSPW